MLNPNGPYMKVMTTIALGIMVVGAVGYGVSIIKEKASVTNFFVTEFRNA